MIKKLIPRELQVLNGVANGSSMKELAKDMGTSYSYMAIYRRNIANKLRANNFEHALAIAFREGILK